MKIRGNAPAGSSLAFLDFCKSFNLTHAVKEPTHGLNVLDLVLTSDLSVLRNLRNLAVLPPFGTSDHCIIFLCGGNLLLPPPPSMGLPELFQG